MTTRLLSCCRSMHATAAKADKALGVADGAVQAAVADAGLGVCTSSDGLRSYMVRKVRAVVNDSRKPATSAAGRGPRHSRVPIEVTTMDGSGATRVFPSMSGVEQGLGLPRNTINNYFTRTPRGREAGFAGKYLFRKLTPSLGGSGTAGSGAPSSHSTSSARSLSPIGIVADDVATPPVVGNKPVLVRSAAKYRKGKRLYCSCQQPYNLLKMMVLCDGHDKDCATPCSEWFHPGCVGMTNKEAETIKSLGFWMCPHCREQVEAALVRGAAHTTCPQARKAPPRSSST